MVGRVIGKDHGGILNRSPAICPEDSTVLWQYYVDWTEVMLHHNTIELNIRQTQRL